MTNHGDVLDATGTVVVGIIAGRVSTGATAAGGCAGRCSGCYGCS